MKQVRKKYKSILIILVTSLLFVSPVNALTSEQLDFFAENNIYFYDPGANINCLYNKDYKGQEVWTKSELEIIEENKSIYDTSAKKYGLTWQLLAVVHYQEHSLLKTNPSNGQGIYQLYSYTNGGTNENRFEPTTTSVSDAEFQRQTDLAAQVLQGKASGLDLNTDEGIKNLFLKYNGEGGGHYADKAHALGYTSVAEGSPYVMNKFDEQRDPESPNMNPSWRGYFTGDGVYDENATSNRYGTFVRYMAISDSHNCDNADITETAINLSWEGRGTHSKDNPKPEYTTAMKSVDTFFKANGEAPEGASCDQFVATVMRYSGADPDFPKWSPLEQKKHMENHPEMYQMIGTASSLNNDLNRLQSGDILVMGDSEHRHIYIYINTDGTHAQASASYNERTGEHYNGAYLVEPAFGNKYEYTVFRRINR